MLWDLERVELILRFQHDLEGTFVYNCVLMCLRIHRAASFLVLLLFLLNMYRSNEI